MTNGRAISRITLILAFAVALTPVGAAILDHQSSGAAIEPVMTWQQHVERVDEAFASQDLRTAREVVAQNPLFRPYLVGGEEEGHRGYAHDQGQDYFQSRAHLDSSTYFSMQTGHGDWVRSAVRSQYACDSW